MVCGRFLVVCGGFWSFFEGGLGWSLSVSVTTNVNIVNSFNSELLLKDTESLIKTKPIDLLPELKDLKFGLTLDKEF